MPPEPLTCLKCGCEVRPTGHPGELCRQIAGLRVANKRLREDVENLLATTPTTYDRQFNATVAQEVVHRDQEADWHSGVRQWAEAYLELEAQRAQLQEKLEDLEPVIFALTQWAKHPTSGGATAQALMAAQRLQRNLG